MCFCRYLKYLLNWTLICIILMDVSIYWKQFNVIHSLYHMLDKVKLGNIPLMQLLACFLFPHRNFANILIRLYPALPWSICPDIRNKQPWYLSQHVKEHLLQRAVRFTPEFTWVRNLPLLYLGTEIWGYYYYYYNIT